MGLAPTAPVTAQRVRDGEPAALAALVDRRGAAVLAYCEAVAGPGQGGETAGDAFARFRREVVAADEPRLLDPEAVLLRSTRLAAAAAAPRTVEARGLVARRLGATCVLVPELLAARAEGSLTAADRLRLSRHLEKCATCREAEERFAAGERAYQDAPNEPPPAPVAEALLVALRDAAPNADREPEAVSGPSGNGAPPPIVLDQPTLAWDAADVAAASSGSGSWTWVATRVVIPAVVFAAAFVIALAVGGVFSDDDGGPTGSIETQSNEPPAQIRVHARPVTTPLPEGATGATGATVAPAPSDATASAGGGTTTFAAASSPAPVAAAPPARQQTNRLDAEVRTSSESSAPPPEQSAPATTEPAFQQQSAPPPAP